MARLSATERERDAHAEARRIAEERLEAAQACIEQTHDHELISSLVGVSEHQACVWAVTHTTGQAKQVWRNAHLDVVTTVLTFASLTDVFRAGLGIHNDEWEAREKLHNLSQTASVKAYARKFIICDNQIQDQPLTGYDKVYGFIAGLKPDLRRLCMVNPSRQNQIWAAEDFDRLDSYALNIEASFNMQPTA